VKCVTAFSKRSDDFQGRDDEVTNTLTFDQVFEAARQSPIADPQLLVGLLSPPKTIEQIAAEQGIGPFDFRAAQAEARFWPEDESAAFAGDGYDHARRFHHTPPNGQTCNTEAD
jgi:hypothetical protein